MCVTPLSFFEKNIKNVQAHFLFFAADCKRVLSQKVVAARNATFFSIFYCNFAQNSKKIATLKREPF
jgi:hypothetical protein